MLNNKINVCNGNYDIKEVNSSLNDLRREMHRNWINTNRNLSIPINSPNLDANNRVRNIRGLPKAKTGRVFNSYDNINTFNAKSNTNNNTANYIEYSEDIEALDPYNDSNNNTMDDSEPTDKKNNKKPYKRIDKSLIGLAKKNDYTYPYYVLANRIVKLTGSGKNQTENIIIFGVVTDYQVLRQYGDNGRLLHKITIKTYDNKTHDNKTYTYEAGSTEEIRDWIYTNNFGKDKKMILNFLNHTLMALRQETTKYGILGGYRRLEDIHQPKNKKPAKYLNKWLQENFREEQLRLFKSLILLPFHSIIRNDEDAEPRGLVRAIIGEGDSDQLKSLTTNFVINCFSTHEIIPLADNRSSDSFPALRNDCHNHTGILMCDEADKLIVDWIGGGKLVPEAVNFIKRMEQSRSLNVADLNRQGKNMGSLLNSTPVFLWNGFIEYVPTPLNDRLLLCPFHKENKPEIKQKWKMKQGKKQMILFGEHLSWAFHQCYENIKTMDTETATNTILQYLIDEYNYDMDFLIETPLMYTDTLQEAENIRENIIGALRNYISQTKIEEDFIPASQQLQDNKKFKSHLSYCKKGSDGFLRIKVKTFTDWVNRNVLKGGEVTPTEIAEMFNWEITKYNATKVFYVTNLQIGELLDLNKKTGEEDK